MRLTALAFLAAATLPSQAKAGVTITWTQVGSDFHAVVSGSFSAQELAGAAFVFESTLDAGAYFDTTPSFSALDAGGQFFRHAFLSNELTFAPSFIRLNSYSGNTATGDPFSFFDSGAYFIISLPTTYVAGDSIDATLTSFGWGNSLQSAFTFGEVVKRGDTALVTFVDGSSPVPEPSAYGLILGGLALAGVAIRRRRAK